MKTVIALVLAGSVMTSCEARETHKKSPWAEIDASATAQRSRLNLIGRLTDTGVFYKIEKLDGYLYVYVGPAFADLAIDYKKSTLSVVMAYYYVEDSDVEAVMLLDYRSGEGIGLLDKYGRLHLD